MFFLVTPYMGCEKHKLKKAPIATGDQFDNDCAGAGCVVLLPPVGNNVYAASQDGQVIYTVISGLYNIPNAIEYGMDTGAVLLPYKSNGYWDTAIFVRQGTHLWVKACGKPIIRLSYQFFDKNQNLVKTDQDTCSK